MYLQYGFSIFGRTIYSKNQRNFKSPWFNKDCFTARQQFRKSHRVYSKNTYINANILLSKKRHYVNTKKKARYSYNRQMRDKLTGLAKNIAKAFWNEINKARKGHDVKPSISNLQFFNYFKETFSGGDIFTNPDIENELHSKESSNICIEMMMMQSYFLILGKAFKSYQRIKELLRQKGAVLFSYTREGLAMLFRYI